ncbi:hypothetical protein BASA82_000833 [Batrachochytrium salamandrivorans]|nr:hypothetical protein BASA82_000833 [Batrachochytrium salamandrivorans]
MLRRCLSSSSSSSARKWFSPSLNSITNKRIVRCNTLAELEHFILRPPKQSEDFSPVNIATSFSRLGKLVTRTSPVSNPELVRQTLYQHCKGQTFTPREISTICHGLVQSGLDSKIPPFVSFDASLPWDKFSAQDLTLTVWAFAKLGQADLGLFSTVQNELLRRDLRTLTPMQLANICWSFANLWAGEQSNLFSPLFAKIGSEVADGRPDLSPFSEQDVSTLLQSFAKMGFKHIELFDCMEQEVVNKRSLNTFTAQGISTTLWSFAALGINCPLLLDKTSHHLQHTRVARDVEPLAVSQILWSFTALGRHDPTLFAFLLQLVQRNRDQLSPRLLIRILHSVAKQQSMGEYEEFTRRVAVRLSNVLDNGQQHGLTSHDFATLLWSLTACAHYDSVLFHKLAKQINLKQLDSQDVSNIFWSFATTRHQSSNSFCLQMAEEIVAEGLQGFSFQSICNLCWSFAQLGLLTQPIVQQFFQLALPKQVEPQYFLEHATQLRVAKTWWERANPNWPSPLMDALSVGGWVDALVPPPSSSIKPQ